VAGKGAQLWDVVQRALSEHSDDMRSVHATWDELLEWIGSPEGVLLADLHVLLNDHTNEVDGYLPTLGGFQLVLR